MAAAIVPARATSDRGCTRSPAGSKDTTKSPCTAATAWTAARAWASIGKIHITRLGRERMRSRLARSCGLAGSLLPTETTLTSAKGSTRGITALDEMPIFALILHPRMYCPAPTAMLSPTTTQHGLMSRSAPLATAVKTRGAKVIPLNRDSMDGMNVPSDLSFPLVTRQAARYWTTPNDIE